MNDTDKVQVIFDDARANGLEVDPARREPGRLPLRRRWTRKRVRYGLGAVKGTGEQRDRQHRRGARGGGPFRDLGDFCRRVDRRVVNRRAMEALIKAGRLRRIEPNRASLLASLGAALELADQAERFAQQTASSAARGGDGRGLRAHARAGRGRSASGCVAEKQSLGFYL